MNLSLSQRNHYPCNAGYLFESDGNGAVEDLYRSGLYRIDAHLRALSWRIYGYSCQGRKMYCHHKPQFCGQNGTYNVQDISFKPRNCGGNCKDCDKPEPFWEGQVGKVGKVGNTD